MSLTFVGRQRVDDLVELARQHPVERVQRQLDPMVGHAIVLEVVRADLLGTPAAFHSTEDGRDIQSGLIDYVADFVTVAAGKKFNPHVTIGVAPQTYLDKMFAEPFKAFTFSPAGAAVYQLGTFGAVRKELRTLALRP